MEKRGCARLPDCSASSKYSSDELRFCIFLSVILQWQKRDHMGLKLQSFKGFLPGSAPFRQGLNCSGIIAVTSKGNLPQTEAGSSVAVAPGKAELLSFLKCQPGTGTGNGAVISSCTLSACCPRQQRQAASFSSRLSLAPLPNLKIQI